MCFYNDPDWTAQLVEDEVLPVTNPVRCGECRRTIEPGDWRRHISLQEYEYCRNDPENDSYDAGDTAAAMGVDVGSLPSEGCMEGCQHDFGESLSYDRCLACDQLLRAIQEHELDEGCDWYESQPNLERLYEAMNEGDGKAYLAKAEELYPGITARLPAELMWFRKEVDA